MPSSDGTADPYDGEKRRLVHRMAAHRLWVWAGSRQRRLGESIDTHMGLAASHVHFSPSDSLQETPRAAEREFKVDELPRNLLCLSVDVVGCVIPPGRRESRSIVGLADPVTAKNPVAGRFHSLWRLNGRPDIFGRRPFAR